MRQGKILAIPIIYKYIKGMNSISDYTLTKEKIAENTNSITFNLNY